MSAATFIWVQDENGQDVRLQLPLRAQIQADSSTPVPVQQARLTAANDTVSAVILADDGSPVPVQQARLTAANDTVSVVILADDQSPVPVQQAALTAATDTVSVVAPAGALVDHSGTLTTGGVAQQAVAADSTRKFFFIQNVDPAEALWINETATAVIGTPSIQLAAGAYFPPPGSNYIPTGAISVIATTIGHPFVCKVGA